MVAGSVLAEDSGQVGTDPATDFVQSLARGLAVIRAFDAEHPELSLSDVARRAGISRAAARRFLRTLETLGYVRSVAAAGPAGKAFVLTPRVLELGYGYLSALSLPELVQPHLEVLSREVDESVSAAILDGDDVVYIARVPTRKIMSVRITLGTRLPAAVTSMGRVLLAGLPASERAQRLSAMPLTAYTTQTITALPELLAELDQVAQQGWALVDGELESGLRSLAAPIHGKDGSVVAALNVSTSATRDSLLHITERYLPRLLATASAVDAELRLI